jgi:hypothetical protein
MAEVSSGGGFLGEIDGLQDFRMMDDENNDSGNRKTGLKLLSVVIPARDEEGCIASTVEHLHLELKLPGFTDT